MDEHACADGYSPKRWRWGTFIWAHAHAQASPVVGPVAVAVAGSCGGGDWGFPPSAVGGWRGVDQYVKIESDATHPAIPPPPCPLPPFVPLVPLHHTPARQRYNRGCPVRLRVSRLNRLICHPRIIFFEGGWISGSLRLVRERDSILVAFSLVVRRLILPRCNINLRDSYYWYSYIDYTVYNFIILKEVSGEFILSF